MFGTTFGHGTLRKYVIYFGTLFNNIWIQRYDNGGSLIQRSKVPLNYGPREKFLARLDGNEDLQRPIAIQLPRMTFEITGIYYDPSRKLSAVNKTTAVDSTDPTRVVWQYQPVPYNIDFTLSIMTKNIEDGTYIIEQILPYFNPVWTATLNLNPELGQKHDVPITLDNVLCEDTYSGNFTERRAIIWTLTFTMRGYFFGPTQSANTGIIKEIDVYLRNPGVNISMKDATPADSSLMVDIDIKPGMYANGMATSESTHLYSYTLANTSGTFDVTEKVYLTAQPNNFLYVAHSNSTVISAYRKDGTFAVGDSITGLQSGATATIANVNITPELSVTPDLIYANSNYGTIVNFIDDL